MSDTVEVAVSGVIDRPEKCPKCGRGMLFRVDSANKPFAMFCGTLDPWCPLALKETAL